MSLPAGTRFGPYEVLAPLGAGGMGEVYRARDTRLDRSVALKVLPADYAHDAALRLRFEREAKAISQLEHPNICRLYDVGEATPDVGKTARGPSAQYLVMELLDGTTLADRLRRGPLPLEQVVQVGSEIAAALHAAHRRGIVHRDLKPGNVMLTKSGAKLLDFGLARAIPRASDDSPTEAIEPLTAHNVIVGTIAYMSPEQVNGGELDARSDIFSLGIVLYEMLNGRRPFAGGSVSAMMHAIAEGEPLPVVSTTTPLALAQIIRRCLEKNRDDRFQSAADAAFALSTVLTASNSSVAIAAPRTPRRRWIVAAAAISLVAAGAVAGWLYSRRSAVPERVVRFKIAFSQKAPLAMQPIAISPDGSMVAYVREAEGTNRLYLRSLSALDDTRIKGSDDAQAPFFSADSASVAFVARGKLKRLRIGESDPVTVADVGAINSGTWGTDGTMVVSSVLSGTLLRVSEAGGAPAELTHLDPKRNETMHERPQLLADGHTLLFRSDAGFGPETVTRVEALDLRNGSRKVLLERSVNAHIFAFECVGDVLWFVSEQRVQAVRLDLSKMQPLGAPVTVIDDEEIGGPYQYVAAARDGTVIYTSGLDSASQIVRIGALHGDETLRLPEAPYVFIALSPDERRLALTTADNTMHMNVADLERGTVTEFGPEGAGHIPLWTPDGSHLLYSWAGAGASNTVSMRADGSGNPEVVAASPNHQDPGSISPDGKWLAYAERDPATSWDIWLVPLEGPRNRIAYLRTPASEYAAAISPDGARVAYTQVVRGGAPQIFVDSFPSPRQRTLISEGEFPAWSRDGKTLYFLLNHRVLGVPMSGETPGSPRVAAERVSPPGGYGGGPYAPMKDGSLMVLQRTTDPTITVVMHLTPEVERLTRSAAR